MLSEQEAALMTALMEATSLVFAAIDKSLQEQAGVTHAQFEILVRLAAEPDGLRMTDLAGRLLVSRSGLTYQATVLEKAGLIERVTDERDERATVAGVTQKGRDLLNSALPAHLMLVKRNVFDHLRADEVETIGKGLARVASSLRDKGRQSGG
jgi:DNA-binding MarR family transcriptional regulator